VTRSWGLRRAVARRFADRVAPASHAAHAARLDTYLSDLLAPYDLALSGEPADGQNYGEMAAALLPDEPVDALVLAYDIPDIAPGRATATYLSHACPGRPVAFAVSDQGPAGAHTALRLLYDYARSGPFERALLLVVEQSSLPFDPGVPVTVPAAHVAVAVHLGPSGLPAAMPRVVPDVDPGSVASLLGDVGAATLILGAALADLDVKADTVVVADPAQPMTGVWAALAALPGFDAADGPGTAPGPVVLADYDPRLRYLCVTAFGS
jgi:hypothetical protein